jgi:DNA polymerase III delta prime subunit
MTSITNTTNTNTNTNTNINSNTVDYKFDDYIKEKTKFDIQPIVTANNNKLFQKNKPSSFIYYGPNGVGKYSCVLQYLSLYSKTRLAYEKKLVINTSKGTHTIKMSDIHFEVDINILGCNAKQLWNDIIIHINDVVSLRKNKLGFIVCKNFQDIHSELLEVFYSYMQTTNKNINLYFILLTNSVSFIPRNIINRCHIINIPRPKRVTYNKIGDFTKHYTLSNIENIKQWKSGVIDHTRKNIVDLLVNGIENIELFNFAEMRDKIYDILVLNQNSWNSIWEVLHKLIKNNKIPEEKAHTVLEETYRFLELYNNNYRPIYHLERYVYFLATIINEL